MDVDAHTLAYMRMQAEAAARTTQPSGEVTFDEIVNELSRALGGRPNAATLAGAELATERAFVQLDDDVAALILHAASRGVPYVLVSDMYLAGEQILDVVRAASAAAGIELPTPGHVFVSGERRTNKATRMFEHVLGELGVGPREVFHVGDHPDADVAAPTRQGMHTEHFLRDTPVLAEILARELRYRSHAPPLHHYDVGLRTLRLKAATSAMDAPAYAFDHFQYGAFVLGRLFTLFAEWIVEDCLRHAQRRVYCMTREAHLLRPLIEKAARAVDAPLDVRTLWVSRYAVRGASFHAVSEPGLREYLLKRRALPIRVIAGDLGLDLELLRRLAAVTLDERLAAAETDRVVAAIVGARALREQLLEVAGAKRQRFFDDLGRAGVFEDDRLTLVDLGWGGTIQRRLADALADRKLVDVRP